MSKGVSPEVDTNEFIAMINSGLNPKEISHKLKITLSAVYRLMDKYKAKRVWKIYE